MINYLLKFRPVICLLVLIPLWLFAWSKTVNGQEQRGQIIATTHLDTNSTTIVSFDYFNHTWDTLFTVNDYQAGWVW